MNNQAYIFLIYILNGFLISVFFDVFRIIRKTFKTKDFITYIQDILFWVLTGIILLYSIFKFNNGEIRLYIFIGVGLGITLYTLYFSKTFIKVNVYILDLTRRIINFIVIKPVTFVLKIFKKIIFKPFTFLIINTRKILSVFKVNIKSLFNKKKKGEVKKDFV